MTGPFAGLADEFTNWARYLFAETGDDAPVVTVEQTDPDTGETVVRASRVAALKLTSTGQPVPVGDGGQVGIDECQFYLVGGIAIEFAPKHNDRIIEPSGAVWIVNLCERIGYGPTGTLYRCPVTRARADA